MLLDRVHHQQESYRDNDEHYDCNPKANKPTKKPAGKTAHKPLL
jgi:hypothetical protein